MADNWKDDSHFTPPIKTSTFTEGRSYGKGRGFITTKINNSLLNINPLSSSSTINNHNENNVPKTNSNASFTNNNDDDWKTVTGDLSNLSFNKNDKWDSNTTAQKSFDNNWEIGGGQSFEDADDNNDDYDYCGRRDRGRANRDDRERTDRRNNGDVGDYDSRGRSRNHDYKSFDNDNNADEISEVKKPPVTYIPPERSMDDSEVYGSGITAGINFEKYDNIPVNVTGDDVPRHIENFDSAELKTALIINIKKSGYKKPTPVQKYSIPIMMNGRDLMSCAQTGSGKTAAYLIPIIHNILKENDEMHLLDRGCEPQAIILAPTRELVIQICWEAQKFSKNTVIKCVSVYGGVSTMYQVKQLERGAHIIIATPGRLADFVQRGRIGFSKIRFVVLDEADRMLDSGFLMSMESILGHETMVPTGERQTVMFSATFSDAVQNLAARFMNNYLFLSVGMLSGACDDIEQNFYEVEKKNKRRKLAELLNLDGGVNLTKKTLIFVETKRTADFIAIYMSDNNFPSTSIHGDREQREREIALNDFKSGRTPILVATSVAARGLDIPEVSHVINFDLPNNIDEYVHRIGRTGRMGNIGRSTSFYDPKHDSALGPDIVRILTQANKEIPEFLKRFIDGNGFGGGISSGFGAHDIRRDHSNGYGNSIEPEENW